MKLYRLSILQAHEGLVKKKFSAVELAQAVLRRIESVEAKINAFITITPEVALAQAEGVDTLIASGQKIEPLTGIPVAIKDLFCTKDIKTTAASNILSNYIPQYDATVVKKLKEVKVTIVGKTNCDAFAHGSSGENSDFGITRNPWNLRRVPGGSSSGSAAALAAGECLFATGTDTGGSIRLPAAFCNLVGLKPTYGRVSRYGIIAMASSLDSIGHFARDVLDAALVLNVTAGRDPFDATTPGVKVPDYTRKIKQGVKDLKVGLPKEYFVRGVEKEVRSRLEKAVSELERLGAKITEVSLPHTSVATAIYYILQPSEVSSNLARYDGIKYGYSAKEALDLVELYYKSRSEGFGDEAKRRIMLGTYSLSAGYYEAYYLKATKVRAKISEDFDKVFKKTDVIVAPVSPTLPFMLGEKVESPLQMYLSDIFTIPVNLAGLPALAVPCGFSQDGLPIGMQIIGPQFSEELLFQVGYAYEQATEWHKLKPRV